MEIPADAVVCAEVDGQPVQWRTLTDLFVKGPDGQIPSRPLTPEEVAAIETERAEREAEQVTRTNSDRLAAKVDAALLANAKYLTLTAPTNAQVVAQVRRLTLENNAIIRFLWRRLTDISDTEG